MSSTSRYRLTVRYDGRSYHGWQLQDDVPTVQGVLEQVLEELFDRSLRVYASGRTDRGVHALCQPLHVDVPDDVGLPRERWHCLANERLPDDVWLTSWEPVPSDFHARHDAVERAYGYRLGRQTSAVFNRRGYVWLVSAEAWRPGSFARDARALNGEVPTRVVSPRGGEEYDRDRWPITTTARRGPNGDVWLLVRARSFRYRMVRGLARALVRFRRNKLEHQSIREWLEARQRCLQPAPPDGCYLLGVRYPNRDFLQGHWNRVLETIYN